MNGERGEGLLIIRLLIIGGSAQVSRLSQELSMTGGRRRLTERRQRREEEHGVVGGPSC